VVTVEVGPETYEVLMGISKTDYERQLLELIRTVMMDTINESAPARSALRARGLVESVELVGEGLDTSIVMKFRLDEIPGVQCGWRMQIWPAEVPDGHFPTAPEDLVDLSALGIVEIVESTPRAHLLALDRDDDGVLWL
jgi:hypothetical protein